MKKRSRRKKGLAILLTATMVVGLMPGAGIIKVSAEESEASGNEATAEGYDANGFCTSFELTNGIWALKSGETCTHGDCKGYQPAVEEQLDYDINGDGTTDENDKAYKIINAGQLYWFAQQVNTVNTRMNAILTCDITVNSGASAGAVANCNGTKIEGWRDWTPIGIDSDHLYSGIFDGNGHTVSGLYFNDTNTDSVGLFGKNYNTIKNVGVIDSYFRGRREVGGVCGSNYNKITNCYNTSSVSGAGGYIGGVCGWNSRTITNCYDTGTVSGTYNAGGVCGIGSDFVNCYYLADSADENGGKTEEQFHNGEVAYLLSQGCKITIIGEYGPLETITYNGSIWGQTLAGEKKQDYPALGGDKVYWNKEYAGCKANPGDVTYVYSNTETETVYTPHRYQISSDGMYHECSVGQEQIYHSDVAMFTSDDKANTITATCTECGALGTVTLIAPTDVTYNGTAREATVDNSNSKLKGAIDITYSTSDGNAPVDAGTYTASITLGTGEGAATVSVEYTIARRPVTITADNMSMTYGETDPALSFTVSDDTPLVDGEVLSGELSREAGEDAGTYKITQGTVTNDTNPNYDITFSEGTFTINKAQTWETADCVMNLVYDESSEKYTATIETVPNAEYRFDGFGFDWSNANILIGISPHKSVTGYIRIAGDKNHEPGPLTSVNKTAGHGLKHVAAKAADCENDGNIEYWHCVGCDNNYSDSEGNKSVGEPVISKLGHKWSPDYAYDETSHWYNCKNANCPVTDNSKKEGFGYHSDSDNNGICDVCGYRIEYIIAVSILDDNGSTIEANVDRLHNYIPGAPVKLIVPVIPGYNFVGWYNKGSQTGDPICKSRTYEFKAEADRDLVAVYKPIGSAELTIDGGKSFTINGDNGTSGDTVTYPLGSQITVVCNDSGFEYWKNSAGMVVSRDKSYTFTVTGKETISAVFNVIEENQVTVVFESYYGQVIARDQYATDATLTETPGLPFRYGYTALGWDYNGDGTYDASEDTFAKALERGFASEDKLVKILPVYQLIQNTYRIEVYNGTGAGTYKQNEVVTVEANAPSDGMKFSHWVDGAGNILSYNEKYQFYAAKEITVTAVYVEDIAEVEAKGTTEIVDMTVDQKNGKLIFVSMSTVPEGCTIEKAGIIATNVESVGTSGEGFNADTAAYVRGNSWTGNAYRYTWTKSKVGSDETWYVRAYLVYTDAEGNVNTVYGDMVKQIMK